MFGEVAAKPRRVQSLHPRSKLRIILARRIKYLYRPVIAHVVKDDLLHYVVVHKIGKKKITIADPAEGIVQYSHGDFFKIWSGVLILLAPNDSFEKKDEIIQNLQSISIEFLRNDYR